MSQSLPDTASEVLRFAADASQTETSVSFYSRLALKENNLQYLLAISSEDTVSPGQVSQIACLIRDASIKAYSYKVLNTFSFWSMWVMIVGVALVPIVNYWFPSTDKNLSLLQTALTAAAALLFTVYQQYKQKQGKVEDALRRTLFIKEPFDHKLKRLVELFPSVDTGMSSPNLAPSGSRSKKEPNQTV